MDFVKVNGKEFYYRGKPILFSGLGVGSWLNMEHFMLGLPGTDKQIRETFARVLGKEDAARFFDSFILNFLTEEDFLFLKESGVNLLRVPFSYRLFIDDENPGVYKEEGFGYMDRLLALCSKYEIFLMPDLHTVPGGQNPDWHSDNTTGIPQFWHFRIFQEQIVKLWQDIAQRYRDEPFLLGYDLLNEPFLMPKKEGVLNAFFEEVTKAVRKVDKNHIIFIEGDFFSMDFSDIRLPADEQTALTFHFTLLYGIRICVIRIMTPGRECERWMSSLPDSRLCGINSAVLPSVGKPGWILRRTIFRLRCSFWMKHWDCFKSMAFPGRFGAIRTRSGWAWSTRRMALAG